MVLPPGAGDSTGKAATGAAGTATAGALTAAAAALAPAGKDAVLNFTAEPVASMLSQQ